MRRTSFVSIFPYVMSTTRSTVHGQKSSWHPIRCATNADVEIGAFLPSSTLHEVAKPFNLSTTPTVSELFELRAKLDYECLRYSVDLRLDTALDVTSEVDAVVQLAVLLSRPLSQIGYPGTLLFQEQQLRALVSVFALLFYHKVHTLDPHLWDNIKQTNIFSWFQKIAFQVKSNSELSDRIRHAPSVYLIQLASQYAALFNRGESPLPSTVESTLDTIFAGLSLVGPSLILVQASAYYALGRRSVRQRAADIARHQPPYYYMDTAT